MQERVCLVCEHHECVDCAEDHGTPGLWITCCGCGFGALVSSGTRKPASKSRKRFPVLVFASIVGTCVAKRANPTYGQT
jgi:hypothetical protein